MEPLNRKVAIRRMPPSSDDKRPMPPIAVALRRQTLEEERHFHAALELLLAEMVRQHFDREGQP